jgi:hypothetical protein
MAKADAPHLRIRIEPALLARLEKAAAKNDRPLTAEITARLIESFRKDDYVDFVEGISERLSNKVTLKITEVIERGHKRGEDKK